VTHCKIHAAGALYTKLQKVRCAYQYCSVSERQLKQVSFRHSSECQQRVRISYLGRQTVPGARRCDRERSVAKCGTPSWRQLQRHIGFVLFVVAMSILY